MNQKTHARTLYLAYAGLIAALYVALTYASAAFGLASGAVQLRLSEILTVLPYFTPAAVPGLFVGCLLANVLTGCAVWDVVFGSLATLVGALVTRALRKKSRFLAPVGPIAANTLIVPLVLRHVYGVPGKPALSCADDLHRGIRRLRHPRHGASSRASKTPRADFRHTGLKKSIKTRCFLNENSGLCIFALLF